MNGLAPGHGRTGAGLAIARRVLSQLWVRAAVWAAVFGATAAASALSYAGSFPTVASRQEIAATTGRDAGLAVLLGPVAAIGTVGGYTVYKCFVFLTTVGAIWAIVTTTRLLRGEEDEGRWQLTLAGTTTAGRATAATLAGVGAAVGVIFLGTTLLVLVTGRRGDIGFGPAGAVVYGLSIVVAPLVFAAVAAVTSQLGRTRRLATGLAMGLFGVALVVRMIADSGPATRWLRWLTPFGWTELMRPFTANDLLPLVPATFAVAGLTLAAVAVAARRDAGGGALASRDMSPVRPFGLASPLGLAVRVELPVLAAWCAGAAAAGLVLGIIANVATGPVPASLGDTLDKFGVRGTFVNQYLSVAFLLLATIVALLPAGQAGDALEEETSGRLAHALVQPTHRAALFAGRLAVSGVAIGCAGVLAGVAAWGGARTQGIDLGLGSMVGAGLNLVPTALVALAVGALALAVVPRTAPRAVYVVVIGSLIGDLLGSLVPGVRWLDRVSLFHYMALAPAEHPQPRTIALTVAAAVALCALATALFDRRDVEPA